MLVSKAFTARTQTAGPILGPAGVGLSQLPQTAEALATVDKSMRSVATRAECTITFANFFIVRFPSWVEASVEDINTFSVDGDLKGQIGSFRIRVTISF